MQVTICLNVAKHYTTIDNFLRNDNLQNCQCITYNRPCTNLQKHSTTNTFLAAIPSAVKPRFKPSNGITSLITEHTCCMSPLITEHKSQELPCVFEITVLFICSHSQVCLEDKCFTTEDFSCHFHIYFTACLIIHTSTAAVVVVPNCGYIVSICFSNLLSFL